MANPFLFQEIWIQTCYKDGRRVFGRFSVYGLDSPEVEKRAYEELSSLPGE